MSPRIAVWCVLSVSREILFSVWRSSKLSYNERNAFSCRTGVKVCIVSKYVARCLSAIGVIEWCSTKTISGFRGVYSSEAYWGSPLVVGSRPSVLGSFSDELGESSDLSWASYRLVTIARELVAPIQEMSYRIPNGKRTIIFGRSANSTHPFSDRSKKLSIGIFTRR